MNNKKILFFDIDGTLISETSGEIPESTKTALKKAQENGHITIINTGRTRALIGRRLINSYLMRMSMLMAARIA